MIKKEIKTNMKLISLDQLSTQKDTIQKDNIKLIEELVQKNLETWNQKIKREFLESINATKVSEIELHCTMDKPMPGIVSSVLIARLEVELKESGFQFERTERNSFIIKNPFFENSETNNSFISAPPPGYFGDKQPVRAFPA